MSAIIYKLYFFLIPFFLLFKIPENATIHISHISTVIMLFGIVFCILEHPDRFNTTYTTKWIKYFLFLIIYPILIAFITYSYWGVFHGETTIDCIIGGTVLKTLTLLSIIYNIFCLAYLISLKEIIPLIKIQSIILLIIGYLQVGVLHGLGTTSAYAPLCQIFCTMEPSELIQLNRGITLFGSEPSSVAHILIFLIPFIFILELHKKFKVHTILWTILILFFSGSTQTVLSFIVLLIGYFIIITRKHISKKIYIATFTLAATLAIIYAYGINLLSSIPNDNTKSFIYIAFYKIIDPENQSLAMRTSTIANDIKIFFEFPFTIFGIGDGIQGMLYNINIPDWIRYNESTEIESILIGEKGIANGGSAFFPAFISGYGIIGILFTYKFLKKYFKDIKLLPTNSLPQKVFELGILMLLISNWITCSPIGYESFIILLTLPYIGINKRTI